MCIDSLLYLLCAKLIIMAAGGSVYETLLLRRFFRTQSLVQNGRIFRLEFDVPSHGGIRKRGTVLKRVNDFCVRGTSKPVSCVFSFHTAERASKDLRIQCSKVSPALMYGIHWA